LVGGGALLGNGFTIAARVAVREGVAFGPLSDVGNGVTVAGSGVVVIGTYIIHGVCVTARVAGGVSVGLEPQALNASAKLQSMRIIFRFRIFTTAPKRIA